MATKDYGFAVDLANGMNWNMGVCDFRFSQFLEPEGCFVLFDGLVPVGVATCISFGTVGWFGNFVIKPQYRGCGGGRLLLKHAVDYLQGRGVETVGLYAYPHFRDFYGGFGFKADLGLTVMYNSRLQLDNLAIAEFETCVDFSVLSRFDVQFFGADRSRLLREIVQKKANLCYVSKQGQNIVGYILAKVWDEGVVEVGPLVCRSDQPERAVELLKVMLSQLSDRQVLLYLSHDQRRSGLEEFLLEVGFRKDFSLLRMFLGKSKIQSGIHLAESLERG
ncbi:MAG: GNAT family N-acetyltransferase [Candidatus Bathyarchaeota archaeon]|nr:GNAT family N-acetyltransferase [Candidatus Termiticorpusculum sp.]